MHLRKVVVVVDKLVKIENIMFIMNIYTYVFVPLTLALNSDDHFGGTFGD